MNMSASARLRRPAIVAAVLLASAGLVLSARATPGTNTDPTGDPGSGIVDMETIQDDNVDVGGGSFDLLYRITFAVTSPAPPTVANFDHIFIFIDTNGGEAGHDSTFEKCLAARPKTPPNSFEVRLYNPAGTVCEGTDQGLSRTGNLTTDGTTGKSIVEITMAQASVEGTNGATNGGRLHYRVEAQSDDVPPATDTAPNTGTYAQLLAPDHTPTPIGPTPSPTPTPTPSPSPSPSPSPTPTATPTGSPTASPTGSPTASPTGSPTASPTGSPTASPTGSPTASPTGSPTASPTGSPTASPTGSPTASPTGSPTASPTGSPTASPTGSPTASPTGSPTASPTGSPTASPTDSPTASPTGSPTASPTTGPTSPPTPSPTPSEQISGTATVSDDTPAPGQPVTVSGSGYAPGAEVRATLFSHPRFLGSVRANNDGSVRFVVIIPADVEPGTHTLELAGAAPGGALRVNSQTVVVGGSGRRLPVTGGVAGNIVAAFSVLTMGELLLGFSLFADRRRRRPTAGDW